jgi:hypothetical protein
MTEAWGDPMDAADAIGNPRVHVATATPAGEARGRQREPET